MQGSFPVGADWNAALDPDNDEVVARQARSDQLERQINHLTQLRNPGAPLPPNAIFLEYREGPYPPTTHFQLHGELYYVLKWTQAQRDLRSRDGRLGHYTVTTVVDVDAAGARLSRPFLHPERQPAPVPVLVGAPGTTAGDPRAPPNQDFCLPEHYTVPGGYREIGLHTLIRALESAEALDLAFARRMEGLANVAAHVCWDCLDPDYDPSDRPLVRDQFLARYLAKFYDDNEPGDFGPTAEDVADEAVEKHRALCKAWAKKHYRTLTPYVTAPAEALASEFYRHLEPFFPQDARLTRAELARVLMRHPETAAEFAHCLHDYSSGLEQTRGGRNASYKAMSMTSAARVASHRRMGNLLAEQVPMLREFFSRTLADPHERWFHPYAVDWYAILGQMPHVHKFFDSSASLRPGSKRRQNPAARERVPPWRAFRD